MVCDYHDWNQANPNLNVAWWQVFDHGSWSKADKTKHDQLLNTFLYLWRSSHFVSLFLRACHVVKDGKWTQRKLTFHQLLSHVRNKDSKRTVLKRRFDWHIHMFQMSSCSQNLDTFGTIFCSTPRVWCTVTLVHFVNFTPILKPEVSKAPPWQDGLFNKRLLCVGDVPSLLNPIPGTRNHDKSAPWISLTYLQLNIR